MSLYFSILSKVLFVFFHIAFCFQIHIVYEANMLLQNNKNNYLWFFTLCFCIFSLLYLISYYKTLKTDPGKINHDNNLTYIDFYYQTRIIGLKRAEQYNKNKNFLYNEKNSEDNNQYVLEFVSDSEDEDYPDDKKDYKNASNTKILDEDIKRLNKTFNIILYRCRKCNIVRTMGVHHCRQCKT
jgi:hypothetical protein